MKKKENIALALSILALCFSSYAALACDKRIEADWMGILVGILALLVTTLLGWNIYSAIHIDTIMNKKIDQAHKKVERRVKIAMATIQMRAIQGYIANKDWYMVMEGYSSCIFDILQLQEKRMAADIIPIIDRVLDNIIIHDKKEDRALRKLIDFIKKLSTLDENACDLYKKALEKVAPKDD